MALRSSISVRLDEVTDQRLKALADATDLKPAELIRRATAEYLDRVELDGHVRIPIVAEKRTKYTVRRPK